MKWLGHHYTTWVPGDPGLVKSWGCLLSVGHPTTRQPACFPLCPFVSTHRAEHREVPRDMWIQSVWKLWIQKSGLAKVSKSFTLWCCFSPRYLHFNQIETLDPESFQHLPKLERLWVLLPSAICSQVLAPAVWTVNISSTLPWCFGVKSNSCPVIRSGTQHLISLNGCKIGKKSNYFLNQSTSCPVHSLSKFSW